MILSSDSPGSAAVAGAPIAAKPAVQTAAESTDNKYFIDIRLIESFSS
jgi:hypothetical protein